MENTDALLGMVGIIGIIIGALWTLTWFLVPFKIYGMANDIRAIRNRSLLLAISVFSLAGCMGSPQTLAGVAPVDRDVFSCATSAILAADFSIETLDRASGFIRATNRHDGGLGILLNVQRWDLLTVIIAPNPAGGQSLKVVASERQVGHPNVFQTTDSEGKPTELGLLVARSIVNRCSEPTPTTEG